jgi:NADH-quinone oxidoreductase subunit L
MMLFFGWEGVGLCSYLLIGFWYKNVDFGKAARKAFVMNRIGDLGLLLGLFLIYSTYGTFEYQDLFSRVFTGTDASSNVNTAIALLLFIGAMGKSAQIPLYTWLPDAMAGPTPVSALIHAATMVTAGIYLVIRSEAIYALSPFANEIVMWIGLSTSILAALIGLKQNDIKKVLAYSTVSQLGLMFIALGCGAYTAALFHVITHAFFKALLFLGSGSVIHGMHHEQDIRQMGGLRKKMPITYLTFLIGTLAITGFPFLSGFFSKDEILMSAFAHNKLVFGLALMSAGITGFYMFRMFFVTFHGTYRNHHHAYEKVHESPLLMTLPLLVLAVLSVIGGAVNLPHYLGEGVSGGLHHLLSFDGGGQFSPILIYAEHAIELSHSVEIALLAMAVSVFVIAFLYTRNKYVVKGSVPEADADQQGMGKVLANKFYVDEAYDMAFVAPLESASDVITEYVDEKALKSAVDGVGTGGYGLSKLLSKIQNGNIEYYLLYMVIGISLLLAFNLF